MNFDLALACQENKTVMQIASQRFKIPAEDKNQCRMLGLWDAVKLYDSTRGVPFKLFLSLRVKFRCLKWCTENYDPRIKYVDMLDNEQFSNIETESRLSFNPCNIRDMAHCLGKSKNNEHHLNEVILSLEGRDKELIVSRFLENRTLEDIGNQYGVSYETVRKWIKVILEKFKD